MISMMRTVIAAIAAFFLLGVSTVLAEGLCQTRQVILFTKEACGSCRIAKSFFTAYHVDFREIDIERAMPPEDQKLWHENRGWGLPVILIEAQRVEGFYLRKLMQVLCIEDR